MAKEKKLKINTISGAIHTHRTNSDLSQKQVFKFNSLNKALAADTVSFGGASADSYVETIRAFLRKKPEKLNPDVINRLVTSVVPGKKRESGLENSKIFADLLSKGEVVSRRALSVVTEEISDAVSKVTRSHKLPQDVKDKIACVVNKAVSGEKLEKAELSDLRESIIGVAFRSTKKSK